MRHLGTTTSTTSASTTSASTTSAGATSAAAAASAISAGAAGAVETGRATGVGAFPARPSTVHPHTRRPETVLISELIGGDLIVQAMPSGPLAYLAGSDGDPLRAALDAAFHPPSTAPGSNP